MVAIKSSSMSALTAPPGSKKKHTKGMLLEPIENQGGAKSSKRPMFTKKDLTEAVRRLTPGAGTTDLTHGAPYNTTSVEASTRRGGSSSSMTPLALMEWGVNFNARKFNELRTSADRKAAALKARLDQLRALKMEQESLEKMLSPDSPDATKIDVLLTAIQAVNDETDRRLHYRRQLEHILRRLQKNQVTFDSHLSNMDEARTAALREHKDMKAMTRTIEAGHTQAVLELAEAQRLVAVEKGERHRAMETRKTEAEQASRMDAWRKKREIARREFASELRGDLSQEEEVLLQARLTSQKANLATLRSDHEKLQREANSLESAFVAVRQATGVNSLDEVVEKFLGQQGNRRALLQEKREAEERLANAKRAKEEIENRFSELKASGIGSTEMNREIAEQLEREIAATRLKVNASPARDASLLAPKLRPPPPSPREGWRLEALRSPPKPDGIDEAAAVDASTRDEWLLRLLTCVVAVDGAGDAEAVRGGRFLLALYTLDTLSWAVAKMALYEVLAFARRALGARALVLASLAMTTAEVGFEFAAAALTPALFRRATGRAIELFEFKCLFFCIWLPAAM